MDLWDQHEQVISQCFLPGIVKANVTFLPAGGAAADVPDPAEERQDGEGEDDA